jgi:SAM-dependent methyltransferase
MSKAETALDLGTGGGERLLGFMDIFPRRMVATEGYPPNVPLAKKRLEPLGVEVVASNDSLHQILPFPDAEFDLVIDRHTSFNINEVERVLRPGGSFLTQQVEGDSLHDLLEDFGSSPKWSFFTLDFVLEQIKSTQLVVELAQEWTGRMIFKDVGALVFYLKAIPWLVSGFSVEQHLPYLAKQQIRLEREGHLTFHQKLLILKARKEERG